MMKRLITILLLMVFGTAFSSEENDKDNNLSLELTSNMRTLRVEQSATIELKITGQAIAEIIKNTNNIKSTIFNKKPEFVYQFIVQPQKQGDCILGPYSLSFNGVHLQSNALTIKVLPEWKGGFSTLFRVDCNEIDLGGSFELVMEPWPKERPKLNI